MRNILEKKIEKVIKNVHDQSKWTKFKFSDFVDNIVEKVVPKDSELDHYIGLKHLDSGSLKIKRFGETVSLIGDKLKIYKGDLIFAKRNSYLKRVAIADFDAVASAHSMVLRAKPKNIIPEFLPFFLQSEKFWQRAIEISVGSLSPTINWKVLAGQEFLLPPKDQQKLIAKLLWSLDDVVETENNLSVKLKMSIKSEVKSLFSIYKNKTKIKNLVLNEKVHKSVEGVLPYIEIGDINIENKKIDFKNKKSVKGSLIANKDSVLVSKVRPNRGAVTILNQKQVVSSGFTVLIPNNKIIIPNFLFHCLAWNDSFHYQMSRLATGSTYPTISEDDVLNYRIPSIDLNEQLILLKKLDKMFNIFIDLERKILISKALQKSIINKIFKYDI